MSSNFPLHWKHHKGGTYIMKCVAVEEATLRPVVVYFPFGKPYQIFTRPAEEFFDGRFQPIPMSDKKLAQLAEERGWSGRATTKEAVESDEKEHGWQGQLIPKIGMDCDKRSILVGDYVTLYKGTANNHHAWGPQERRKIVDITFDSVRLEPAGARDPNFDVWSFEAVKYAGGAADA